MKNNNCFQNGNLLRTLLNILFIMLVGFGQKGFGQISVTPGAGFGLDGQGAGIFATRPTGADFSAGTNEQVLQIVTKTNTGAVIDYDGDGNREIVVQAVGNNSTSQTQTRLYIFEANSNNDFRLRSTILIPQGLNAASPGLMRGVDVGDVDGDAGLEVVAISGNGTNSFITIYDINIITFAFTELINKQVFSAAAGPGLFPSSGTVNQLKIVANKNGGTNNDILLSNATGTIAGSHIFSVEYTGATIAFVNGVTASNSGTTVNSGVIACDHGDMGDASDEEIVMVTENVATPLVIREYVTSATAPFSAAKTIITNWTGTTGGSFTTVAIGDIDGDVDLDAITGDYTGKFIRGIRRTGVDTYTSEAIMAVALATFSPSAEISDLDNDGLKEAIYSNGTSVVYREQDGTNDDFSSARWGAETTLLSGLTAGTANAVSFVGGPNSLDNDAFIDVVVGRSLQNAEADLDGDEIFFLETNDPCAGNVCDDGNPCNGIETCDPGTGLCVVTAFLRPNNLVPPIGPFKSNPGDEIIYQNGLRLRNVCHDDFTQQLPPPPPGGSQIHSFGSSAAFEVSLDGGNSWNPFSAPAQTLVRVTHAGNNGGTEFFDTEMLQLDISGGNLPPGVFIRESPTLPSLGLHRATPASGGSHINSFFDVFTEVSMDGGQSWSPQLSPNGLRVTLGPIICDDGNPCNGIETCDPTTGGCVTAFLRPNNLLPPIGPFKSNPGDEIIYQNGLRLRNVCHDDFTQQLPPPPPGGSQTQSFGSSAVFEVSLDGGNSWIPFSAPAQTAVHVSHAGNNGSTEFFDTEMLQLDISGGNLPPGVFIRESPTLPSLGLHRATPASGGSHINSFFDVFTEVSMDGGQSWSPQLSPNGLRVTLGPIICDDGNPCNGLETCDPATGLCIPGTPLVCDDGNVCNGLETCDPATGLCVVTAFLRPNNLVPPIGPFKSNSGDEIIYQNGLRLRNVCHDDFTQQLPPPPPGGSQTQQFGSSAVFEVSLDGGNSWNPFSAPAQTAVHVSHAGNNGSTEFFDTEMLQLDISGGNLPPGVFIRESPTKASLGLHRATPASGGSHINSFFDVFTEVSMDGGQSWMPQVNPNGLRVTLGPIICDDGNPCNGLETCDPATGLCIPGTPLVCDDGNPCNGLETCLPLVGCQPGIPIVCDDGNVCNGLETCDPATGGCVTAFLRPNNLVPPIGPFKSNSGDEIIYQNGLRLRNVCHDDFTQQLPPPPPGGSQTQQFGSSAVFEVSLDGGNSWIPFSAPAQTAVHVSHAGNNGSTEFFDTEMLQLDISGGNLPPGVFIRESPTKASLGLHRATPASGGSHINSFFDVFTEVSMDGGQSWMPQVNPNGLRVTLGPIICDDGNPCNGLETCDPATGLCIPGTPLVCDDGNPCNGLETCLPLVGCQPGIPIVCDDGNVCNGLETCDPATGGCVTAFLRPNNLVPPIGPFKSNPGDEIIYQNGLRLRNVCHDDFTQQLPPPPPGGSQTQQFGSSAVFEVSLDGGNSWIPFSAPAQTAVHVSHAGNNGSTEFFDTEMLQLDISGGNLPPGVFIRESPTKASLGLHRATPASGGSHINSFFDVFTEVSMDGGQSWMPQVNPNGLRVTLGPIICDDGNPCNGLETCDPATGLCIPGTPLVCDDGNPCNGLETCLPLVGCQPGIPIVCDDGNVCNGLETCDPATGGCVTAFLRPNNLVPPIGPFKSNPGDEIIYQNGLRLRNVCHDDFTQQLPPPPPGGSQTQQFGSSAVFEVSLDGGNSWIPFSAPAQTAVHVSHAGNNGSTEFFDTEMLQLDISGGNLPPGVFIRESPTKASLGLHRATPASGGSHINSFFDVFTEVSMDGGQSWMPQVNPNGLRVTLGPIICDDGNPCNGLETCDPATGLCIPGTPLVCDDGNPCNGLETCLPLVGCQPGIPIVCDDGNPCNGLETCNSTAGCQPGTPINCGVTLHSNILLQGFYLGGGTMTPEMNNVGVDPNPLVVDVVTISAMDAGYPGGPNGTSPVDAQVCTLYVDGSVSATFGVAVVQGTAYYLKVNHRNSLEIWSAAPIVLGATNTYLFSSGVAQALNGTQASSGDGFALLYTGDITQDLSIDASDFLAMDPEIQAGLFGYYLGDLTGEGSVDASDFLALDPNIQLGITGGTP